MTRVQEQDAPGSAAPLALAGRHARFPARSVTAGWPVTRAGREETLKRLTCAPFTSGSAGAQKGRALGLASVLDWLEDQPGDSWQDRWLASGADSAGRGWRDVPAGPRAAWPSLAGCAGPAANRGRPGVRWGST